MKCKVRVGRGPVRRGTAAIADQELRFHTGRTGREGEDFALQIGYDEMTSIEADGPAGTLTVTTAEHGAVVFYLGRIAVGWKELIDEDRPDLLRDLGITPRSRVALEAIVDEVLEQALAGRVAPPGEPVDVLLAGAEHRADLARLPALAARLRPGGVLWIVHAETSRTLDTTDITAAARPAGLVPGSSLELSRGRLATRLSRPT